MVAARAILAIVAVPLGVWVVIVLVVLILRLSRRAGYKRLAGTLYLTFYPSGNGIGLTLYHVEGVINGIQVTISDGYEEFWSILFHSRVTTIKLRSVDLALPSFELTPRYRLEDYLQDDRGIVDFADPHFARSNRVTGADSENIVSALNGRAQALLRGNREVSIRGGNDALCLFHYQDTVSFSDIEKIADLGLKLSIALGSEASASSVK